MATRRTSLGRIGSRTASGYGRSLMVRPQVLIVGAGQAGLICAAHLKRLGVSTLIVDKHERVGDNWRKRYHSLNLHNPIEMNGFPFLPFPAHYPEYLPKDAIADWLEIYARYLDLDIWSSTEFHGAHYEEDTDRWVATLTLGHRRVTHTAPPAHRVGNRKVSAANHIFPIYPDCPRSRAR